MRFLSVFRNSKVWCGMLGVLSLGLLILLVVEDDNGPDVPNEQERVKADYGEKTRFSRDTWLEFPDFDLIYLGTGVSTGGGMHVPIKSYYFRVVRGREENIIFWTAGTGIIEPIPFEFDNDDYVIEMKYMAFGQEGQAKLDEDELRVSRAD